MLSFHLIWWCRKRYPPPIERATSPNNKVSLYWVKVEKILKSSLDSIPSPSPSVKIEIMGQKVCLRCKSKTLQGIGNKLCFALLPEVNFPANNLNVNVKVMGSNPGYLLIFFYFKSFHHFVLGFSWLIKK